MTSLRAVVSEDVRVIMCLAFTHHAPVSELDQFKSCLLECERVLHAVELTGSFDLMVEVKVASLAEYNERMEILKSAVGHLIARYEANFICRRFVRAAGKEHAIWVPCQNGKVRIDHALIDKVVADGDYMRLHCAEACHLIHMTMHAIRDSLGEDFVQVNRSVLIRRQFITRLVHRNNRWIARLEDGSQAIIAKSHVAEIMSHLNIALATRQSSSSKEKDLIEQLSEASSKRSGNDRQDSLAMLLPST